MSPANDAAPGPHTGSTDGAAIFRDRRATAKPSGLAGLTHALLGEFRDLASALVFGL